MKIVSTRFICDTCNENINTKDHIKIGKLDFCSLYCRDNKVKVCPKCNGTGSGGRGHLGGELECWTCMGVGWVYK
jgi:hypothetical protein